MMYKNFFFCFSILLVSWLSYIIAPALDDKEVVFYCPYYQRVKGDEDKEDLEESNSSSSFFLFVIIIIIIAIITFFVVKKIINNKEKKTEKKVEKIETGFVLIEKKSTKYQLPELKEDEKYSKEFNEYIRNRNKILQKNKIYKEDIKELTEKIIAQMKKVYEEYMKNRSDIEFKNYDENNYLINFYSVADDKNFFVNGEGKTIFKMNEDETDVLYPKINKDNKDIFIKNSKKVRNVGTRFRKIFIDLFVSLFDELLKDERFYNENFDFKNNEEIKNLTNIFIATIIEPFLYYVSENKKNVRFISRPEFYNNNYEVESFQVIFYDVERKVGENIVTFVSKIATPEDWAKKLMFNELINLYFPESKELNEKENNKIIK